MNIGMDIGMDIKMDIGISKGSEKISFVIEKLIRDLEKILIIPLKEERLVDKVIFRSKKRRRIGEYIGI